MLKLTLSFFSSANLHLTKRLIKMHIDEKPVDSNIDLNDPQIFQALLQTLKDLSSAFQTRTATLTKTVIEPNSEADTTYKDAQQSYQQWKNTGNNAFFEQAIAGMKSAADSCQRSGNPIAQAGLLAKCADVYRQGGQLQHVIPLLEESINIFHAHSAFDKVYQYAETLYKDILSINPAGNLSGNEQAILQIDHRLSLLKKYLVEGSIRVRNEPIEPTAHLIGQNEVGFSDSAPLGTINTQDCITIAVQDPVTRKTAVAHIDKFTSIDSLSIIFDRLPKPPPPYMLRAKIIGARGLANSPNVPPMAVDSSKENFQKGVLDTNTRNFWNYLIQ